MVNLCRRRLRLWDCSVPLNILPGQNSHVSLVDGAVDIVEGDGKVYLELLDVVLSEMTELAIGSIERVLVKADEEVAVTLLPNSPDMKEDPE